MVLPLKKKIYICTYDLHRQHIPTLKIDTLMQLSTCPFLTFNVYADMKIKLVSYLMDIMTIVFAIILCITVLFPVLYNPCIAKPSLMVPTLNCYNNQPLNKTALKPFKQKYCCHFILFALEVVFKCIFPFQIYHLSIVQWLFLLLVH